MNFCVKLFIYENTKTLTFDTEIVMPFGNFCQKLVK